MLEDTAVQETTSSADNAKRKAKEKRKVQREKLMQVEVFEAVANWADYRKVDYALYRDEGGEWVVQIRFTDSKGPFSAYVEIPKMDEATLDKRLARACADAHNRRRKTNVYGKAA